MALCSGTVTTAGTAHSVMVYPAAALDAFIQALPGAGWQPIDIVEPLGRYENSASGDELVIVRGTRYLLVTG